MILSPDSAKGDTQLIVQIDEKNLRLLHLGQVALASADSYPKERFEAILSYINPGIDLQRGSVEAKLIVSKPPPYLQQDMTVSVDIQVAFRKNAVLLPASSLHDPEGSSPWVYRVTNGRIQKQFLKIGLRSNGLIEILQGLQAQDQVIPSNTQGLSENMRIRAIPTPHAAGGH